MAGIFLSYRREDAGGHAGRLYDKLVERFGAEMVFRDIDTLRPGSIFSEYIVAAIASADVVIAMIGRDWVSAADAEGGRRLDDVNDYVRLELETAFRQNVRVIPVLVRNAVMPRVDDLPGELSHLAQRHAFELPDQHWPFATDALIAALEDVAPTLGEAARANRGEGEAAGSASAWELAIEKLDINRLEPPELLQALRTVCGDFDEGRRPDESVVTFATAKDGDWRLLLILTSDVLEIHTAGSLQTTGERDLDVIQLSNIDHARKRDRLFGTRLELHFKAPLIMRTLRTRNDSSREAVKRIKLTSIQPRERVDEIARYIQKKVGASG